MRHEIQENVPNHISARCHIAGREATQVATRAIGVATATSSGESYSMAGREGRGGDYIAKTYRDRS
jgi:hypothetical protein